MIKPVGMSKIRLLVLKRTVEKVVEELHNLGVVDINKTTYSSLDSGRPFDTHVQISGELVKIRGLKAILEKYYSKGSVSSYVQYPDYIQALKISKELDIEKIIKSYIDQSSKFQEELKSLTEQKKLLDPLTAFDKIDFSKLTTKSLSYLVGRINPENLQKCKSILDKKVRHYNINSITYGNQKIVLIMYSKEDFSLDQLLSSCGFTSIMVPKDLTFVIKKVEQINHDITSRSSALEHVNINLQNMSNQYYPKLVGLESALSVLSDRSEIVSNFSSTSSVFIIEGWVKSEEFVNLEKALDKYGDNVSVDRVSFDSHHEFPPVALKNPSYADPIEFITRTYSLPNYTEIDPTMIYFLTVPIIYGMIVGDVGYAIISILLAKFLMKKFPNTQILQTVSKLWILGAIPSIVFGVIFDEW